MQECNIYNIHKYLDLAEKENTSKLCARRLGNIVKHNISDGDGDDKEVEHVPVPLRASRSATYTYSILIYFGAKSPQKKSRHPRPITFKRISSTNITTSRV